MPGYLWCVSCTSREKEWEVAAGWRPEWEAGAEGPSGRLFIPAVCPSCREIVTAESKDRDPWLCSGCTTPCSPLPGAVLKPGEELPEELTGVTCPNCSNEALRASCAGVWD